MIKFLTHATRTTYQWICTIPTAIWVVILGPAIAVAGTEVQKFLDTRAYPEIDKNRINVLSGKWGGYGIQPVTEKSSIDRLNDRKFIVEKKLSPTIEKDIKDCMNKSAVEKFNAFIMYPAHLSLEAKRTSFLSRKTLTGTLEITPRTGSDLTTHKSSNYNLTGRLEQHGDYIRLDYINSDPSKKEFGTILLEYNSDGKLCGKFVSYGPISRSIVQGDYVFGKE
jgi:hypothetical protein